MSIFSVISLVMCFQKLSLLLLTASKAAVCLACQRFLSSLTPEDNSEGGTGGF